MGDWTSDLISKPAVAMIKRSEIESSFDNTQKPSSSNLKSTEAQQKANDNNKIQQEPKAAPKETKSST
jgi:hypothetical protein